MYERTDGRTDELMNGRTDKMLNRFTNEWMKGRTDKWMNGPTNGVTLLSSRYLRILNREEDVRCTDMSQSHIFKSSVLSLA